jgi:hypothetical protein
MPDRLDLVAGASATPIDRDESLRITDIDEVDGRRGVNGSLGRDEGD